MQIFIQSTDYDLWKIITNGPIIPTKKSGDEVILKLENEWSPLDKNNIEKNFKAMNLLFCAITPNEYDCVSACETAKEIWDKLKMAYEGDSQVKESKIDILVHSYELFKMKPEESIAQMFARFASITNGLKALGKSYSQSEMTRKVLRSMPSKWDTTTSIILQSKDFSTYTMDQLMGSLMTEEMHINLKGEENVKKEDKAKNLALKSTSRKSKVRDDSSDESEDEEMALITRAFKKLLKNRSSHKGRGFPRKDGGKEESSKRDPIICYECKKPGHIKSECPYAKKYSRKDKKKAMMAAWDNSDDDSSDEDDEQQEVANLCLMAIEDQEVDLDSTYSFDELLVAYKELKVVFEKVASKNKVLKKIAKELSIEVNSLVEEKDFLEEENESLKFSLEKERASLKKFSKNESLEKQVDDLTNSLSIFTKGKEGLDILLGKQMVSFHKAGIGYNPTQHKNLFDKDLPPTSHPKLTCNFCRKIGHISSSCHMKIFPNVKKTWVPKNHVKTNLKGPKMMWVPKVKT